MALSRIGRAIAKVIDEGRRNGAQSAKRLILHKLWYWREFRQHGPAEYERWCRLRTGSAQFVLCTTAAKQGSGQIVVSIVCAVFNPPADVLRDTIDSVFAQSTTDWELIVVNAGEVETDNGKAVASLIADYASREPRITVVTLPGNLGISGNLNAGIEKASGEIVFILDHDDLLASNAVEKFIEAARNNPNAAVFYCDEDRVSCVAKTRNLPWFKPRTESPELLLNACYLMHSAIRRQDLLAVGAFRTECDGAQDWDLHLRLMANGVHAAHIPEILYHWRQLETSTALTTGAKPWAMDAQERAVSGYLGDRYGIEARLERHLGDMPRPVWNVPKKSVLVWQGFKYQPDLSIFGDEADKFDIRFTWGDPKDFDNGSVDLVLFLSSSLKPVSPNWLSELARWALLPDIGVVGGCVLDNNHFITHAGAYRRRERRVSWYKGAPEVCHGIYGSTESVRNVSDLSQSCLMMRRSVYQELTAGLNDTQTLPVAQFARERGYRNVYTPHARFVGKLVNDNLSQPVSPPAAELDLYWNPNLDPTSPVPHLNFYM